MNIPSNDAMTQYALNMPLPVAYTKEQFIVSDSNKLAHDWVTRWPDWPSHALYLQAEHGAGKTHLSHIWQKQSNAMFLEIDEATLPSQPVVVENIEKWHDEQALFHLFNHCKSHRVAMLMTSSQLPDQRTFALPDLRSRLKSIPLAVIQPPDDALLAAVLSKMIADRQLNIAPDVFQYILPRLPRSLSALAGWMKQLDESQLASGRSVTIPYIRTLFGW